LLPPDPARGHVPLGWITHHASAGEHRACSLNVLPPPPPGRVLLP